MRKKISDGWFCFYFDNNDVTRTFIGQVNEKLMKEFQRFEKKEIKDDTISLAEYNKVIDKFVLKHKDFIRVRNMKEIKQGQGHK